MPVYAGTTICAVRSFLLRSVVCDETNREIEAFLVISLIQAMLHENSPYLHIN